MATLSTAKQFNLSREQFDYLIDNQIYNNLHWPKISTTNCAIIFDHSPVLKYLTVTEIINVLETVSDRYGPSIILLRSSLFFIDDCRANDRFYNLVDIKIEKVHHDDKPIEARPDENTPNGSHIGNIFEARRALDEGKNRKIEK